MTLLELESLLATFKIPNNRRILTQDNLRWLERNLYASNSNHPKVQQALQEIVQKLRGK